jgi:hypothetical protein
MGLSRPAPRWVVVRVRQKSVKKVSRIKALRTGKIPPYIPFSHTLCVLEKSKPIVLFYEYENIPVGPPRVQKNGRAGGEDTHTNAIALKKARERCCQVHMYQ